MAGLRCLRGKYYARVRLKKSEKLVPLNTTEKRVAEKRLKFINEREWLMKIGWEKELLAKPIPTLSEAVEEFLNESRNKGLMNPTLNHYKIALRHFQKVIGGSHVVNEIKEDHCKEFVTRLRGKKADASINSYIKVLNTFLNWVRRKYRVELPLKSRNCVLRKNYLSF